MRSFHYWFSNPHLDAAAEKHVRLAMANVYLLRPALYALGLLLFVIFDERNVQFIYVQF